MATAPTLPVVSVEEYLSKTWRPDKEFVDGVLVDRSMPNELHGLLQVILTAYFRAIEKEYRLKVLTETRTQIVERSRYRVPDVLIATVPLGRKLASGPFINVPDIVIEILSSDDPLKEIVARFADYSQLGVDYCILMDAEECVASWYQAGSLIRTEFTSLRLQDGREVPFNSVAIFDQLRREISEMEGNG